MSNIYETIPTEILGELQLICAKDNKDVKSQYLNVLNAEGPVEMIAKLFQLPVQLVVKIKLIQKSEIENGKWKWKL